MTPNTKLSAEELKRYFNILTDASNSDDEKLNHAAATVKLYISALEAENGELKLEHDIDTSEIDRLAGTRSTTAQVMVYHSLLQDYEKVKAENEQLREQLKGKP